MLTITVLLTINARMIAVDIGEHNIVQIINGDLDRHERLIITLFASIGVKSAVHVRVERET